MAMVGMLAIGRGSSPRGAVPAEAQPNAATATNDVARQPEVATTTPVTPLRASTTISVRPARPVDVPKTVDAPATVAAPANVARPVRVATPTTAVPPVAPSPAPAANAVALASNVETGSPVTITGCLEVATDGSEFRLTDTEGDAAPKSRGWRSGFLKKSSAPVELIGMPDARASRTYVGHRVAATGVLKDHELRVQSLRSSGEKCD
ncbi:MAG TPA: hypothetical protein VL173_13560 [Vicinamibacterales bacterium]|nr:hypothetical protein [Vicinamibacterales bacterium]